MSGLVEFLRARLDEDERIAKAAAKADEYGGPSFWRSRTIACSIIYDWEPSHEVIAEHVARHDPARVLREVAAMRRILAEHNVYSVARADSPLAKYHQSDRACVGCGSDMQEDWLVEDIDDCPILRALATIYFDHPDYRQEWTP